jgi:hypothetical protein
MRGERQGGGAKRNKKSWQRDNGTAADESMHDKFLSYGFGGS